MKILKQSASSAFSVTEGSKVTPRGLGFLLTDWLYYVGISLGSLFSLGSYGPLPFRQLCMEGSVDGLGFIV